MGATRYWIAVSLAAAAAAAVAAIAGALGAGLPLVALAGAAGGMATAAAAAGWLARDEGAGGEPRPRVAAAVAPPSAAEAAVLKDLPLALILLDAHGRIRSANAAAEALFGPVREGEPLTAMVRARALSELVAEAAEGAPPATAEFKHMQARDERVLLAHVRRVRDAPGQGGEGPAVMVLIEDHTRFARVEQMRKDFIANASHELKTPLASIAGFIETLQGAARDDPAAPGRFLPIMAAQAERMKRLLTDLTSLSRIEMEAHLRPTATVDAGALARETAAALSPLAEEAGTAIRVEIDGPGPMVTGDRDQLSQLFVNLLDNAVKYGGSGGPVRVHAAPPEPGRAAMAGITVTDQGPGIAREHIPRLTERFYRVAETGRKGKAGTGLGLSIVKHILNRHRGDLAIRSAPGQGASFTVWLPRAPGQQKGPAASAESGTEQNLSPQNLSPQNLSPQNQ